MEHHSLEMRSNKYFFKYFLTKEEQEDWIAQGIYIPEENLKQNIRKLSKELASEL